MKNDTSYDSLLIPALRSNMGDWIYYIASVRMRDLAERVSVAADIHKSNTLREYIQRELDRSTHAAKISNYLQTQPQRFFNALVIGVYGGSPNWYELSVASNQLFHDDELPLNIEGVLGILALNGSEKLFAIDGQHRIVGMKQAIEKKPDLGAEEVCAIFVAHRQDEIGVERTRRLFTTLNRYAKPVSKFELIALDEDDVVAITTRRLIDEHPLFYEKISLAKGKSIPAHDRNSFTNIVTLYDSLNLYLRYRQKWADFKRRRPDDPILDEFYQRSTQLWDLLIQEFPPLQEVKASEPQREVAAKYRNAEGGHLLFRPIGLQICIQVLRYFMDAGIPLPMAVERLSKAPMNLAEPPWLGILWDATNQRMLYSSENQRAATFLLYYGLGGDLATMRGNITTPAKLREEVAGLLNKTFDETSLAVFL